MFQKFWKDIDKKVFIAGGLFCLLFLIWTVIAPTQAGNIFDRVLSVFCTDFGWFYLIVVAFFVVFLAYLALSKYGKIILGKDGDKPDYSTFAWFSMLFAAGMGIGLIFWSVAEPMSHYLNPPYGAGSTVDSASLAMRYTFMHWGIHPWSCFGIIGLPLAYYQFRKGQPALLSSCIIPLVGEKRANGILGSCINVLAIFATVFGVATSLGLGAMQINSGLHYVFGIPYNNPILFGIIAVTTVLFITSAVSGIDRGIKRLSNTNMVVMIILLLFIFFAGATLFVTNYFVDSIGGYLTHMVTMSFWTDPFGESNGWINGWTIFYWAWWISWGPFVGGFIAYISKGRTIREFVIGTMIAPVIVSFIYMVIMGGNAIYFDLHGVTSIAAAMKENVSYALFELLKQYPFVKLTSFVAVILIAIFFITGADSSTIICAMMTTKGNRNPANSLKIFWGVAEGAVAAMLLYVGGLNALQSATIIVALPLMFISLAMAAALMRSLREEFQ